MDDRPASRVETTAAFIRGRIASRALARGARLPSVRELAVKLEVSKSTVVEAYDRLAAEGAVVARRGSGFFVAGAARPLTLSTTDPPPEPAVDPSWINRHAMMNAPDFLCPGAGWLPNSWVLDLGVQRALRLAAREDPGRRRQYDEPLGYAPLRRLFSVRLAERAVMADPDQIVVTDSCSQALDLVCRFLLSPNDTVVVDDPCYFNFHSLLRANRARSLTVPMTPDGPDVAELERLFAEHRPRLYLTTGGLHNPTGATPSAATVHRVLRLAEEHDVLILEDDTFADFEAEPSTQARRARRPAPGRAGRQRHQGRRRRDALRLYRRARGLDRATRRSQARHDHGQQRDRGPHSASRADGKRISAPSRRPCAGSSPTRWGGRCRISAAMASTPGSSRAPAFISWARLPEGVAAADVARHAPCEEGDVRAGPGVQRLR